ncbi:MAG: OmpA family protein [Archangium sp.]
MRALALVVALSSAVSFAQQQGSPGALTFGLEGTSQMMLTPTYRDRFTWGGGGNVRAGVRLIGPLFAQLGIGSAWYPVANQAPGNLATATVGLRASFKFHPTAGGPFVDFNVGPGFTGPFLRFTFDAGAGWTFYPAKWLGLGLMARYQHIVQPDELRPNDDGHLLTFGGNVVVPLEGFASEKPAARPVEVAPVVVADTDNDGLKDDVDKCVTQAEDKDGIGDGDGCPEDDHDGDGVADASDKCPLIAEVRNGFEDDDGCADVEPAKEKVVEKVVVARGHGEMLPQTVYFAMGSDVIQSRFLATIAEVCKLAAERSDIRVKVIGHADEKGTRAGNARLSATRAGSVSAQLVKCGMDPERIESASWGDSKPLCKDGKDAACLEQNRRVGFELLPALSP